MGSIHKLSIIALVLTLVVQTAFSDDKKGKISGHITDEDTGEPIVGANVIVTGTNMGASTDFDGKYFILNIDPGVYSLTMTMIGYARTDIPEIRVRSGVESPVNAALPVEILRGGGGDVVQAHSISTLPSYLPSIADSIYMVADTSKRGKYTVPIYVINMTDTAWRIPTVDWTAWITPVVSKNGETSQYIANRSAFCGNSAFGSTLPANSYEIYKQPYRSQEHATDSIHYSLRLTEPIRNYKEGEFLHIKSAQYPGTISNYDLDQALWGRDHIASLSQSELRDVLQNKIDVPKAYELRAKTEAIKRISLFRDLLWLGGIDRLKLQYHNSKYSSRKEKDRFLSKIELKIQLRYLKAADQKLDIAEFPLQEQLEYHRIRVMITERYLRERHQLYRRSVEYTRILQTKGLTSDDEYLRAAALQHLYGAQEAEGATVHLLNLLNTDESIVVKIQALHALGYKHNALKGDSLKALMSEIAEYEEPELRGTGYQMLYRISGKERPVFLESYTIDRIREETVWNRSNLLYILYHLDSLNMESIQLLRDMAISSEEKLRKTSSSVAHKHLETLFKADLEDDPKSLALLDILAVLALDDVARVQQSAIGIQRFGIHDERVIKILLIAQEDMKSDFPEHISKRIEWQQNRSQQ